MGVNTLDFARKIMISKRCTRDDVSSPILLNFFEQEHE